MTQDLTTYSATGSVTRQLDRTAPVSGETHNCIAVPAIDKNGDLYGRPAWSKTLLAYSHDGTLKWKYYMGTGGSDPVVGADGNIYFTVGSSIVGLAPNLAPNRTQPTKVLQAYSGIQYDGLYPLRAYTGGIIISGPQPSSWQRRTAIVSYSGQILLNVPLNSFSVGNVNAQGTMFEGGSIAGEDGEPDLSQVSSVNPITQATAWTTTVSTPGAPTDWGGMSNGVFPAPNGGVVVDVREQLMEGGTAAVPEEFVDNFVYVNGSGQKIRTITFHDHDSSGNTYTSSYVVVDTAGNLVVVRNLMEQIDSTTSVPSVEIQAINLTSGNVIYSQTMRGNHDDTQGPVYGYKALNNDMSGMVGPGAVYLNVGVCTDDCYYSADMKLRAVKVSGLGMDYLHGTILAANVPSQPRVNYVALGDSFSSGEALEPFIAGTDDPGIDEPGSDECHRSEQAYPFLLSQREDIDLDFQPNGFAACSGAETKNITTAESFNTEPTQWTRLSGQTNFVTVTIGGNDIGFGPFSYACIVGTCAIGSDAYAVALNKLNNTLPTALVETYNKILDKAPIADVYVLGYPYVTPEKESGDPPIPACYLLWDSGFYPNWSDAQAARDITTRLNDKIRDAVLEVQSSDPALGSRLHFVDVNAAGSPFEGHELCSTEVPYFQNVNVAAINQKYVFHPNAMGQAKYAELAADAMAR
ncbi:SGNH/GDSL hydrolase family protein [Kribbella sp. NPDC056345]|uniref:SGNH/GDSL hydrolase family protein n=1 Tax=Kribbella sp. NPDC056345 TaxID=3345789 RepID=UPI0035D830CF